MEPLLPLLSTFEHLTTRSPAVFLSAPHSAAAHWRPQATAFSPLTPLLPRSAPQRVLRQQQRRPVAAAAAATRSSELWLPSRSG